MANNRRILLLISLALALLGFAAMAMQIDFASRKDEVNQIKKNNQYIYGEGVAETAEDSEKLAEIRFAEALAEYIQSVPELDSADVVIIPPVKKEMKKITFDRTAKRKVTFLYILKSEIAPLMKNAPKGDGELCKASIEPCEQLVDSGNVAMAYTIAEPIQEEIVVIEPETIDDDNLQTESRVESEDNYQLDGLSAKEVEIIKAIIEAGSFGNIREYLVERKASRHDIIFRGSNSFGSVSDKGLWIIFDNYKNIIAVLGKDTATPLYTKAGIDDSDFSKNGKIWLKIN